VRKVAEIMTREVVTAPGSGTVREAVARMAECSISCLLVARDGRPAGIITERAVVRLLLDSPQLGRLNLYDIMSCPVVCVEEDRPIFEAAILMKKHKVRRLVVVDDDRRVLGLVTQTDIVRAMSSKYVRTLESALEEKNEALRAVGKSLVQKTVFLDNLLRCAEMGIVAADESLRVTYCNPEAETIFGVRSLELIGRDLREVHVQHQVDLVTLGLALEKVTPERSHDFTFSLDTEEGTRRFVARVSGIYDTSGQPGGYVLMVRDDTERRRAEEDLERLTRNLETLVVERTRDLTSQTRELERANERLRGLDEIKSAFLSSVSHELRTPLTSLLGFAKLISRDFVRYFAPLTSVDPTLARKASRIEDNLRVLSHEGERLARLLIDFLDLSRIESGRMHWRDREVSLAAVIEKAVAAVAGLFSSRPEVDLEMRLPERAPVVLADPDRLEQVLLNLIGNAAKFTSIGAVTVSLSEPKPGLAGWRSPTRGPASPPRIGKLFSTSSDRCVETLKGRPRPRARAWGWPSAGRSSPITAAGSGSSRRRDAVLLSCSNCRPRSWRGGWLLPGPARTANGLWCSWWMTIRPCPPFSSSFWKGRATGWPRPTTGPRPCPPRPSSSPMSLPWTWPCPAWTAGPPWTSCARTRNWLPSPSWWLPARAMSRTSGPRPCWKSRCSPIGCLPPSSVCSGGKTVVRTGRGFTGRRECLLKGVRGKSPLAIWEQPATEGPEK
jgi:PAS domain S-box-containing protein